FFKQKTAGATVIVGRVTFESWKSFSDAERHAIVVTRHHALARDRVQTTPTLAGALTLAEASDREIFVCGGQKIFEQTLSLPQTDRLYLTLVHAQIDGDRFFPEWRNDFPRVIARRESRDTHYRYTFLTLGRDQPDIPSSRA